MQLGAVVRLDRGFPLVATDDDTFRAEHAVGFAKSRGEDEVLLPPWATAWRFAVLPGTTWASSSAYCRAVRALSAGAAVARRGAPGALL